MRATQRSDLAWQTGKALSVQVDASLNFVARAETHKFQCGHRSTDACKDFEGVELFDGKQFDPSPFGSFFGSLGRRSATKRLALLIEDLRLVSAAPHLQLVDPRSMDARSFDLRSHNERIFAPGCDATIALLRQIAARLIAPKFFELFGA